MTKAENRAAARAYAAECEAKRRAEWASRDIEADLRELDHFRHYFQRERKVWDVSTATLISAIDDLAERLTGSRTVLHAQGTQHVGDKSRQR